MIAEKDDGGFFHPQAKSAGDLSITEGGITLREWFAGQAMAAIIAKMPVGMFAADGTSYERASIAAYRYADAMIATGKGGAI